MTELDPEDVDWMGIHATRLNGHLLRTIFRDIAYPEMITNPDEIVDVPQDTMLIIAAGYRPGASTDLRAVQIATHCGATKGYEPFRHRLRLHRGPAQKSQRHKDCGHCLA